MRILNYATILIGLWFIVYGILFAAGIMSVTYMFTAMLLVLWGVLISFIGIKGVKDVRE